MPDGFGTEPRRTGRGLSHTLVCGASSGPLKKTIALPVAAGKIGRLPLPDLSPDLCAEETAALEKGAAVFIAGMREDGMTHELISDGAGFVDEIGSEYVEAPEDFTHKKALPYLPSRERPRSDQSLH